MATSLAMQWSNRQDLSDISSDQQVSARIGDTFSITFTCATAAPPDVTGWAFSALIAPSIDSAPAKTWTDSSFNTKTSGGAFTLSAITADTSTLQGRSYYIRVKRVDSGNNLVITEGFITLEASPDYVPVTIPSGIVTTAFGGTGEDLSASGPGVVVQLTAGANLTTLTGSLSGTRFLREDLSWQSIAGVGSVTSVSVTTANGISGTVATATTTPAITLTLGAITPSSVAATGNVTGANLSGTNTGDQTNISGNAATVSVIDAGSDTTTWPLVATSQTGNLSPATNSALTFNAATANLSCTTFTGALVGNASTASAVAVGGITDLGTGVATALATNVGIAGAFVTFNGAGGTPSSIVLTNATGTAAGLTAGTVTTNANLTGPVTSVGNATTIASGVVTEAMQVLADNTTQDVSTTKHGYAPKAPNDATKFLDGTGAYSTPSSTSTTSSITNDTTTNATMYPVWVTTASGNQSLKVASSKLTFNPSTGTLTTTIFGGALAGNADTATTAGTASALATPRTIGGSNFDGSANVTSFPSPGAIGGTTPAAGTFTALTGTSGSITGLTALAIRDTSAAFDVTLAAISSTTLTAGRTLTLDLVNAARTLKLTGNPTLADWFDQSVKTGASPTFVTVTAALSGNASTATTLATPRAINGVNFDGSAAITVTAAAGTLTGTTLNSTVVTSSLTSVGALTGLTITVSDSATSGTSTETTWGHNTSGTAAAGFGSVHKWQLQDSTTADTDAANVTVTWATATHASRKARVVHNVYDTAVREALRLEASGTAPMIGFLGASASAALASPDLGTLATTFGLATGTPTFAGANVTGNISGAAASLSISGQTGLLTFTGLASTNRAKTVRDAADTILELGGSYTPTGTWTNLTLVTPACGTPSAINLTNGTALPVYGITASTSTALGVGSIELGHATDTSITRSASGKIAVEGKAVPLASGASDIVFAGPTSARTYTFPDADGTVADLASTQTFTNKRNTKRTGTTTSSATPTINTDNVDYYSITALAVAITSFTTNLSGTPTTGQTLWIDLTDDGTARAITWGSSFESYGNVTLPTTTVLSTKLSVGFIWNPTTTKWRCVATA